MTFDNRGLMEGSICSREDHPAGVSPSPWRKMRAPVLQVELSAVATVEGILPNTSIKRNESKSIRMLERQLMRNPAAVPSP